MTAPSIPVPETSVLLLRFMMKLSVLLLCRKMLTLSTTFLTSTFKTKFLLANKTENLIQNWFIRVWTPFLRGLQDSCSKRFWDWPKKLVFTLRLKWKRLFQLYSTSWSTSEQGDSHTFWIKSGIMRDLYLKTLLRSSKKTKLTRWMDMPETLLTKKSPHLLSVSPLEECSQRPRLSRMPELSL